jgi:hypothetical protein
MKVMIRDPLSDAIKKEADNLVQIGFFNSPYVSLTTSMVQLVALPT